MSIGGVNEVEFHDGEGADHNDFNNVTRYLKATLLDQILGSFPKQHAYDALPDPTLLYSFGCGGFAKPTGVARTVSNSVAGTVGQWITSGESDGLSARFLVYRLAASELSTQLAVGDGTHPRWDGIFVKLSYLDAAPVTRDFEDEATEQKTSQTMSVVRNVQLQKSVVAGTPAASPVMPATPAGYVPWAYVYVPTSHNAVFTTTQLSDARMPTRYGSRLMTAEELSFDQEPTTSGGHGTFAFRGSNGKSYLSNDNAHGDGSSPFLYAFPGLGADHRILRVRIFGVANATVSPFRLVRYDMMNGTDADPTSGTDGTALLNPFASSATEVKGCDAAGSQPAIWGNGYPAGMAEEDNGNFGKTFGVRLEDAADFVYKLYAIQIDYAY